jgi:hypothetical protein
MDTSILQVTPCHNELQKEIWGYCGSGLAIFWQLRATNNVNYLEGKTEVKIPFPSDIFPSL